MRLRIWLLMYHNYVYTNVIQVLCMTYHAVYSFTNLWFINEPYSVVVVKFQHLPFKV